MVSLSSVRINLVITLIVHELLANIKNFRVHRKEVLAELLLVGV